MRGWHDTTQLDRRTDGLVRQRACDAATSDADADEDGRVSLTELAGLFDAVRSAPDAATFPQPLRALAGSLQLLPLSESATAAAAADLP